MRRFLAFLILATACCGVARAEDDAAAFTAKVVGSAMARCNNDGACVDLQIAAFDRMMKALSGPTEQAMYEQCVAATQEPYDVDWVEAEKCLDEHMKAPPPPKT